MTNIDYICFYESASFRTRHVQIRTVLPNTLPMSLCSSGPHYRSFSITPFTLPPLPSNVNIHTSLNSFSSQLL